MEKLLVLSGTKMIGIDSEWRPSLTSYEQNGVSILQLSNDKEAFVIDLDGIEKSAKLNDILTQIFNHPDSIILGFGFKADVSQFARQNKNLTFIRQAANFLDVQDLYAEIIGLGREKPSLSLVCEQTFDKKLCKAE